MIEFNHARRFTLTEVQTLFRALLPHIESIPNVYSSEGIFRIPGSHHNIVQITEDILNETEFAREQYKVHDYMGALKHGLMNCEFNKDDKLLQALKFAIEHGDQTADIEAIKHFINALVNSEEKSKYAAGEVIYDYLHFLTRAADFASKNHMDDINLGMMAGPLFANLIEENPKALLNTIQLSNVLCARVIREKHFLLPFQEAFPEQFKQRRRIEIAELEAQCVQLQKSIDDLAAKLPMMCDKLSEDQRELVDRKKMPFHHLSKKTKLLEQVVAKKQQSIQSLINEDRENSIKLKKLDAKIQSLNDELLKPGKVLRFTKPNLSTDADIEHVPEVKVKRKKKTVGPK
ncbi:MAG: RhoGAP domain-containing protein [Candidatus Berkiella sp.]